MTGILRGSNLATFMALAVAGSCVTVKPVVVDRTAELENQILGRMQQLEANLILRSSVRGERQRTNELPPGEKEAVQAAMRRAFNADDIAELKQIGQIGETTRGDLRVLVLPGQPARARWVRRLVQEENADRLIIMRRVLQTNAELTSNDMPLVRRILYRLLLRASSPGDRVQRSDGKWVTVAGKGALSQ